MIEFPIIWGTRTNRFPAGHNTQILDAERNYTFSRLQDINYKLKHFCVARNGGTASDVVIKIELVNTDNNRMLLGQHTLATADSVFMSNEEIVVPSLSGYHLEITLTDAGGTSQVSTSVVLDIEPVS